MQISSINLIFNVILGHPKNLLVITRNNIRGLVILQKLINHNKQSLLLLHNHCIDKMVIIKNQSANIIRIISDVTVLSKNGSRKVKKRFA